MKDRVAELKRARVYARHVMWPEAIEAMGRAARLHTETPLSEYEQELVLGATGYNFGCAPLYEDAGIRAGALALKSISPVGRALAGLLGRSLHWRIKQAAGERKLGLAAKLTGFVAQTRV